MFGSYGFGSCGLGGMLYQLVTARLDGGRIGRAGYYEWAAGLVEKGIGGFIVFGGGLDEVRGFVESLQGAARAPLFIMSDVERGVGWQLDGATSLPCQMALCAALDPDDRNNPDDDDIFAPGDSALLDAALSALAVECLLAGINMPLVPVLDVNSNPDNPIVCTRAFSDRPEVVGRFGARYVRALSGAGLISCPKHFPGHGNTRTDSHIKLPVIERGRDALYGEDLPPFAAAVAAGAPAVMVGHIGVPALDDVLVDGKIPPATLSRRITTDLLRREMGFGGLVVTDALNMGALKEFRHAPAACLKAGADVLLHPEDPDGCVEGLFAAINEKFLDEADVRRAYENILAAKEKFSLRPVRDSRIGRDGRAEVDFAAHAALSLELHRRSVTLLKGALAPFHPKRALLVLCGEYAPEKPRRAIDLTPLRDAFGVVVGLAEFTAATPRAGNKPVMFAVFTSVSAWRGTSGLDDDETGRLKSAIAAASARTCVISFGSPYVLSAFGGADVLIAAYEPSEGAQRAVVGCLMGEAAPRGRLPVVIPGL